MKLSRILLGLLALATTPAFASSLTLNLGQETYLPECGGTIEAKVSQNGNGGDDQINLVLRNVKFCSNFLFLTTGKEYKINGADGNRSGSYTISAGKLATGYNTIRLNVRSNSGAHQDEVSVPVMITRNNPAPVYNCSQGLCVGDQAINVADGYNYPYVQISAVQADGKFVIRYLTGTNAGLTGGNWTREDLAKTDGCAGDLCVGSQGILSEKAFSQVSVVAIQSDGRYVVKFLDGTLVGLIGHKWTRNDIATYNGCTGMLCVGDRVFNTEKLATAKIVARENNGNFVIRFLDGALIGLLGNGWSQSNLVFLDR